MQHRHHLPWRTPPNALHACVHRRKAARAWMRSLKNARRRGSLKRNAARKLHWPSGPAHEKLRLIFVGRKVIMSHFAQSNSESLISTVMPFCAKADNASEGSMDVHPCTHRPGSVTARSGASSGYLTQYGG